MNRFFLALCMILLFVLCFGLTRCGDVRKGDDKAAESPYLNHNDTVKYVGMKVCAQCHSDKHETFIHTGMGMSFDTAAKKKSSARFHDIKPVYDAFKDLYYKPHWKGEDMYILEYRLKGRDTVHSRLEKISYIIGSGQHTNSHMVDFNGFIYQAPITWYSQEGHWDLPPGYENGQNSRFSRLIGFECMSCHNALPKFDLRSENHFIKIPDGIDCERCHGPGEVHVSQKKAGILVNTQKETDYSIVNPSKLPWELQVDVCQRCHLQGNAVLKDGKNFDDFRPGMKLSQVMDVFMPLYEGADEEFIMASHAQRLQMSQCFIQSTGNKKPMTCITCHNPHVSVKVTGKEVFNLACMQCHQEKKCTETKDRRMAAGDDCAKCHMPKSGTIDIPHVTVHDHYIRKRSSGDSIKTRPRRFKGLYAINNPDPDKITLARAYLSQFEKFERNKKYYLDSASAILATVHNPVKESIHLAYLKMDYAAVTRLSGSWQGEDAWTSYRIGRSYHLLGKAGEALPHIQQAVKLASMNLDFQNELSILYIELGNLEEASRTLDFMLGLQPKQAVALSNRGYVYFLGNNIQKAKEYYESALRLDPDYTQAWLNLAGLYSSLKDYAKAKKILLELRKKDPNNQNVENILQQLEKVNLRSIN